MASSTGRPSGRLPAALSCSPNRRRGPQSHARCGRGNPLVIVAAAGLEEEHSIEGLPSRRDAIAQSRRACADKQRNRNPTTSRPPTFPGLPPAVCRGRSASGARGSISRKNSFDQAAGNMVGTVKRVERSETRHIGCGLMGYGLWRYGLRRARIPTGSLPRSAAGCMTLGAESRKRRNVKASDARRGRASGERGAGAKEHRREAGQDPYRRQMPKVRRAESRLGESGQVRAALPARNAARSK